MATFPALTPSDAPITPGAWPATAHKSLNGAESSIRHGSAEIGRTWRPLFVNITEANFQAILSHYRGQRSGFDSFGFTTTTLVAGLTPAGFAWLYASPPQVVDEHTDCFTVQCEFRCEPRGLVVVPGKAWRTRATTFTPGGRTGGIVYGSSVAWATAATTFAPGSRNNGVLDPNFSSVVLLCGFNGLNGSTSFVDEGPLGLTLTAQGSPQISTAQSVFGGSSLSLNGSSSLVLPTNSSLSLSGDFTVDARCRFNANGKMMLLGGRSGVNHQITKGNSGGSGVLSVLSSAFDFPEAAFADAVNTWFALRWAKSGTTMYFFADGTLLGSGSCPGTFDFSGGAIGTLIGIHSFDGFIDELRITTMCRSTTSYTVDTAPFPRN